MSNSKNTPTPRTEEAVRKWELDWGIDHGCVDVSFARELERELTQKEEYIEHLEHLAGVRKT